MTPSAPAPAEPDVTVVPDQRTPDAAPEGVLSFPWGLPGFPGARRLALAELPGTGADDTALRVLGDLDDPALRLLVVPPGVPFPDHAVELDDATVARLDLRDPGEALLLVVLSVDGTAATANLVGPVVVNTRTLVGLQAVLPDPDLSTRTPLPAPPPD